METVDAVLSSLRHDKQNVVVSPTLISKPKQTPVISAVWCFQVARDGYDFSCLQQKGADPEFEWARFRDGVLPAFTSRVGCP